MRVISRGDDPPYPPKFLTIGAFSRASRLSPKALRLYDELGLLRPVRVDEHSGYRYYSPDQLEQARLVAWLRRIGLPLAKIAEINGLPRAEVAAEVTAFLAVLEADFAERTELTRFLISYLSGGDSAMQETQLAIRYAAASDIGRERERNQDTAYAGPRLLAVADGLGPGGDVASETVVAALRPLESAESPGDLLNALSDAVTAATSSLYGRTESDPEFAGSGSTLTAMLFYLPGEPSPGPPGYLPGEPSPGPPGYLPGEPSPGPPGYLPGEPSPGPPGPGSRLALVHIGDTRAYLLRDGGLFQITQDHSVVQSLIDAGRLTPEEAWSHPQRALLLKALGAADADAAIPDLSLHEARPGDRYLLCSDGLTSVVPAAAIRETLTRNSTPEEAVQHLIAQANAAGGPDNIACAVADITKAP